MEEERVFLPKGCLAAPPNLHLPRHQPSPPPQGTQAPPEEVPDDLGKAIKKTLEKNHFPEPPALRPTVSLTTLPSSSSLPPLSPSRCHPHLVARVPGALPARTGLQDPSGRFYQRGEHQGMGSQAQEGMVPQPCRSTA